ncbi:hypothetical protein B296_00055001 [Ensete ventricosum]|uniref:Uncharacterized protein n=1 Tax=Ensete ventricosum TaxID=4639 RepID=A0A426Y1G2_ENSVE|nr:hypothetical protein B296_00055001 [Ensete ventricosum]
MAAADGSPMKQATNPYRAAARFLMPGLTAMIWSTFPLLLVFPCSPSQPMAMMLPQPSDLICSNGPTGPPGFDYRTVAVILHIGSF